MPCSGPSMDLLVIPSVVPSGLTLPSLCHSIPWWTRIPNLDFLWLPYFCLASVQKMSWALPALPFGLTSLLVSAIPTIGFSLYFSRTFFSFGWHLWNLPMDSQLPLPVLILWTFGCSAVWSKNLLSISLTNVLTETFISEMCIGKLLAARDRPVGKKKEVFFYGMLPQPTHFDVICRML